MFNSCMFVSDLNPGDCAAWVQAIGSILAIVAAAAFIWWQHRLDLERAKAAQLEATRLKMVLVAEIATNAHHLADLVMEGISGKQTRLEDMAARIYAGQFQQFQQALAALPKADLPNAQVLTSIVRVENFMAQCLEITKAFRHEVKSTDRGLLNALINQLDVEAKSLTKASETADFAFVLAPKDNKFRI